MIPSRCGGSVFQPFQAWMQVVKGIHYEIASGDAKASEAVKTAAGRGFITVAIFPHQAGGRL